MLNLLKSSGAILQNTRDLYRTFRKRKMVPLFLLTLILILISVAFAFLIFVPVLSPFVYPLF